MKTPLYVWPLPSLCDVDRLEGGVAVIIDILRASTTIVAALGNGAARVIPCGTVAEAEDVRLRLTPETILLGGERGGIRIRGFDLGNSPSDYTADVVRNRTIAFTTTNGTRALLHCRSARHVIVGAFLNISAVVRFLVEQALPVHLVCAGTDGGITGEDVLFAGAVADRLLRTGPGRVDLDFGAGEPDQAQQVWEPDDASRIAVSFWTQQVTSGSSAIPDGASLRALQLAVRNTRGGRNLAQLGLEQDIADCCRPDVTDLVPGFRRSSDNRITGELTASTGNRNHG